MRGWRVGVDTGGTYTDLVAIRGAVEVSADRLYGNYCQDRIFAPLRMDDATFRLDRDMTSRIVHGHNVFGTSALARIDDVGEFLRATRAQFLITAPTTLDRNQLDPASLVVVTRKKRRSDTHAPVPVVAAR